MATWVLIMSFWTDAILSQEFTSQERCESAGRAMQEQIGGRSVRFICSLK